MDSITTDRDRKIVIWKGLSRNQDDVDPNKAVHKRKNKLVTSIFQVSFSLHLSVFDTLLSLCLYVDTKTSCKNYV